jgi:hypothetical protein
VWNADARDHVRVLPLQLPQGSLPLPLPLPKAYGALASDESQP